MRKVPSFKLQASRKTRTAGRKLPKYVVLAPQGTEVLHLGPHPGRALHWIQEELRRRGANVVLEADGDRPIVIEPLKAGLGLRVLNTQAISDGGDLDRGLVRAGLELRCFPALAIQPSGSSRIGIGGFDWVAITSKHAWRHFLTRVDDIRKMPKVACVGDATHDLLGQYGIRPAVVAKEFTGAALGKLLKGKILHPTSDPHSPDFAIAARRNGATVVEPIVYRIVKPKAKGPPPDYDLVTFASSQTVRNFVEMAKPKKGTLAACIGPVTAKTARESGFRVVVQPKRYTIPDLVKAIVLWAKKRKRS